MAKQIPVSTHLWKFPLGFDYIENKPSPAKREIENLPQSDIDSIIAYLKGPTTLGLWEIDTTIDANGFIKYLKENYLSDDKELSKMEEKAINPFMASVSFCFSLFYYINQKENAVDDEKIESSIKSLNPTSLKILKKVDINKIKNDFPSAYKIFCEQIISEDFRPMLIPDKIYFFSNHHIWIVRDYLSLSISSVNFESVEVLVNFLTELHHIKPTKIIKLFSPAEKIFSLYIPYLENCFLMIVSSNELQEKISIALSEFKQGGYPHCVNTLGIFVESLLIEIYETLFRQELEKKCPWANYSITYRIEFIRSLTLSKKNYL